MTLSSRLHRFARDATKIFRPNNRDNTGTFLRKIA
jgi:hypothetical protein